MHKGVATVAQLENFDEIIDARTPAEFEEDHIPGAINLPVLDNEQRIIVGTTYKQKSAFEARRIGGAMVAANIAHHIADYMHDKPKDWRPIIYCWRGGQRSGSFTTWLRMIGWDAHQLTGGYKQFRHLVIERIEALAPQLQLRMICGETGSGKTRILEALSAQGAQILDLEHIAAHKGSVLGALPDRPQPTQKAFETGLYDSLARLDPSRLVFVEAESRKIGRVHIPEPLINAMRAAPCLRIEADRGARLDFLIRDYAYLGDDIPRLIANIDRLRSLQSNETLARWRELATSGDMATLFGEFIDLHYDPLYRRSQGGNFPGLADSPGFQTDDLSPEGVKRLAQKILNTLPA